ncbi:hypothetical protein HDU93_009610, partial [Gonapodya sp. JEL0774]
ASEESRPPATTTTGGSQGATVTTAPVSDFVTVGAPLRLIAPPTGASSTYNSSLVLTCNTSTCSLLPPSPSTNSSDVFVPICAGAPVTGLAVLIPSNTASCTRFQLQAFSSWAPNVTYSSTSAACLSSGSGTLAMLAPCLLNGQPSPATLLGLKGIAGDGSLTVKTATPEQLCLQSSGATGVDVAGSSVAFSQCDGRNGTWKTQTLILTTTNTSTKSPTQTSTSLTPTNDSNGGLPTAALAGIIAGGVVFGVAATLCLWFTSRRWCVRSSEDGFHEQGPPSRQWSGVVSRNSTSAGMDVAGRKWGPGDFEVAAAAEREESPLEPLKPESHSPSPPPVPKRKSSKLGGRMHFWSSASVQEQPSRNSQQAVAVGSGGDAYPNEATHSGVEQGPLLGPAVSTITTIDAPRDSVTLEQIAAARPPSEQKSARLWAQIAAQAELPYSIPMPNLPSTSFTPEPQEDARRRSGADQSVPVLSPEEKRLRDLMAWKCSVCGCNGTQTRVRRVKKDRSVSSRAER